MGEKLETILRRIGWASGTHFTNTIANPCRSRGHCLSGLSKTSNRWTNHQPPPPDQQTKCHNTPAYNTWLLLQLWPTKNTHTHTKGEPSSWSGWRWGCSRGGVEVPGELVSGICIFSDSAAVWSLSESMSTAVGVFRLEPAYSLIGGAHHNWGQGTEEPLALLQ